MSPDFQRALCAIAIAAISFACSGRPDPAAPAAPGGPAGAPLRLAGPTSAAGADPARAPQSAPPAGDAALEPQPEATPPSGSAAPSDEGLGPALQPEVVAEETATPSPAAPAERRAHSPPIPAAVTATARGETRVEVRWEPSRADGGAPVAYEVLRDGRPAVEAKEPRLEESGLSAATEYCYAVRARDAAGRWSRPSARACATTPDLAPPAAPDGVLAEARSDHLVALRWTPSTDNVGVSGYEILQGGDVVAVVVASEGEVHVPSPGRYCYTVRATDAAGNLSSPSPPACATTPDLQPPSPPAAAEAVATGETRVALRWRSATDDVGVVRYEVERGGRLVAAVAGLGAAETGLEPWTEYCYTVRAVDAAGNRSAPAGPLCARTLDTTPPTMPQALAATSSGEDRVELSWRESKDNAPGTVGYEVRRGDKVVLVARQPMAKEARLQPFTEYCYTVVAVDGAGNRSAPAGPACARTLDVTPPTIPSALGLYPASDTWLEAHWGASTDNFRVAGYELVRAERVVASPTTTNAREARLAPATEYCYRVRAYDAAGNRSPEAGPVCISTLAVGQPPPPRNLAIARAPKALLTWDALATPGLVYRVYQDGQRVGATRFPTYALPANLPGRRCYTVTAIDGAGRESPRSAETCVAPLRQETASR